MSGRPWCLGSERWQGRGWKTVLGWAGRCGAPVRDEEGTKSACPSSAQSELCCEARKQPLLLFFIKKNKLEDVTGGRAIVREIIMSLGH